MWISFATQTVDRLRASVSDDGHGNESPDWDDATTVTITGCSVQPGATDENLQNRDGALIQWTVMAPPGTDVRSTDRIIYNGSTYDIDGEPAVWPSPTGALDHTVILLKAWAG